MDTSKIQIFLTSLVKEKKWLLIIIGIALILRLAYIFIIYPPLIWSDSEIYDSTAWNMVQGNGYVWMPEIPFAGREPGYALFFLAPIYFFFGHSILAAQIFQSIISIFIILLTYWIAKNFIPEKMSLFSAFLVAIWPPMIAYTGEILTEISFTLLLLLFIYMLIKAVNLKSKKIFFFAGLILGITTLTRFTTFALPLFLLIAFYLIFKSRRQAFLYFLLIFLGASIFIGPWLIRNYVVFDAFVLGRTGGGDIYWMGSYIPWDGEWLGYIYPFTSLCPGITDPIKKDKCLTDLTIQNIKTNPFKVGLIWLKKPLKTFLIPDGYTHLHKIFKPQSSSTIKGLFLALYLGGIILAALGLKDLFGQKRNFALIITVLFLYYFLMLLPLNPVPRYQVPLLPVIAILASLGLNNFYLLIKSKGWTLRISR